MDETPVEQESASGGGAPAKKPRLSRVEKVLFIDWLCFLVASGLLLVHFMVSRSGALAAAAGALLTITAGAAVYEHVVLSREGLSERSSGRRPALRLSRFQLGILCLLVLLPVAVSLAANCLWGAATGALVAWIAGWDVSGAAWLGFFMSLIWCGVTLAYGLVRGAFLILHARLRFGPRFAGRAAE